MGYRYRIFASLGVVVLMGCSEARDDYLADLARQAAGVPFPHPSGFKDKSSHGLTAIRVGKDKCGLCHGTDFSGGIVSVSCFTCHSSYPHRSGWEYPASHGAYTLTASITITDSVAACALCHGDDFQGGDTKFSCYFCHPFPHLTGWDTGAGSHGLYLQSRGFTVTSCSSCHGADFGGGTARVSCSACHTSYPHPEPQWIQQGSGSFHGDTVLAQNGPSSCGLCHGNDFQGGNSGVSCYSCHGLYPHSADWASFIHAPYVDSNSDGGCRGCHMTIKSAYSLSPIGFPNCQFCHS